MPAQIAIEIGTQTAAALLAPPGGGRLPVTPEGSATMPAGVFVDDSGALILGTAARSRSIDQPDAYVADPAAHITDLQVTVAGHTIDPLDLYAAVLRSFATEAAHTLGHPVTAATLVVPPEWGPKRRDRVHEAAHRAGLTTVHLVTSAAAVAAHLPAATGHHGCTLVVDADSAALRLTVLNDDGGQMATRAMPEAGGDSVDTAIADWAAEQVGADTLDSPAVRRTTIAAAGEAKTALHTSLRAAVVLPYPYPPVALDRTRLAILCQPFAETITKAVADILDVADIDRSHLRRVVVAGSATLPGLADMLADATGTPVVTPARTDIAAVDGALNASGHLPTPTTADTLPTVKIGPQHLLGPAIIGAASLALTVLALVSTWELGSSINVNTELITTASVVAMLAAYGVGQLPAAVHLTSDANPTSTGAAALARRTYLVAVPLGAAVAAFYGLAAGTILGSRDTEYLTYALRAAIPLGAVGLAIAYSAPHLPPNKIPGWLRHTRPRTLPVVLATAGIALMYYATNSRAGYIPADIGLRTGALATGAATAITVTARPAVRTATTLILGIGAATVVSLANMHIITLGYAAAASWWMLTAGTTTVAASSEQIRRDLARLLRGPTRPKR